MKGAFQCLLPGALGLALALCGCEGNPASVHGGGGGSEAVALTGAVRDESQVPVPGARVRVRPRLYLQDTLPGEHPSRGSMDAVTDDSGAFRLDSLPPGEYHLEIRDALGKGLLLPFAVTGLTRKVDLGAAVLRPTGSVSGAFHLPDGIIKGRTWVQVYGMERLVPADSAGRFRLDSLPAGTYTLRALNSAPAVDPRDVRSVASLPSSNTDIGAIRLGSFELENYGQWVCDMRIVINTTATGAGMPGQVTDFPLLVRLDASNFEFNEARGDGRDIRFSDARGKRLRYQIERWDSAGARAEVWVRAEIVQGNSRDQFITMHWNKPDAIDWSDGRAVFERDHGFSGVWHMGEENAGTGAPALYADALGIDPGDDFVSSTDRQGAVGPGTAFDGDDHILVPVADPVLKPSSLSVSAWFKATSAPPLGGTLVSMGDNYELQISGDGWGRFSLCEGDVIRTAEDRTLNLLDGAWHQLAATFDGWAMILYVDGEERSRLPARDPIRYTWLPSFMIGGNVEGRPGFGFTGAIDEVVVASEKRSADWIKLAFESQRPGSRLLEIPTVSQQNGDKRKASAGGYSR